MVGPNSLRQVLLQIRLKYMIKHIINSLPISCSYFQTQLKFIEPNLFITFKPLDKFIDYTGIKWLQPSFLTEICLLLPNPILANNKVANLAKLSHAKLSPSRPCLISVLLLNVF